MGLLSLQPLLYSLSLLQLNHGLGREAPNLPRWRSPGPVPRFLQTHLLRPGTLCPAPCPPCTTWSRTRAVSSCKLDLTLVPTGPRLGRCLSLLLAGCLAGPCAEPSTPIPPCLLQGRGRVPLTVHFALPHVGGALTSVLQGQGVIKWDSFLFYSLAGYGLSLCCVA